MLINTKIGVRLIIGLSLLLLLTTSVTLYAINRMEFLSNLTTLMYKHPLTVSNAVLRIDRNIIKIHRSMKDVALAKNSAEIDESSRIVDELEKEVYKDFEIIAERFLGEKKMYKIALEAFSAWKSIRDEVVSLMLSGKKDEAAAITKGKGAHHVAKLNDAMTTLVEFAESKATSFLSNAVATKNQTVSTTYLLVLVVLMVGLTFAFFLTRSITQPISILSKAASEIGKGKLDTSIEDATKDEIGQLAGSFSKMATNLQKTMVSREKYEDLYNNAPIPYFSVDIDGIIKRCNYKAEEMTEYSAGELIGMNVIDLYFDAPNGKEKAMGLVRQFKSDQPIFNEELLMKKKSGEPYGVNLTVNIIKDKDGNVVEGRSVAEDITERKKLAVKLRESEERVSSILRTVGEGIIAIDQDSNIIFTNWKICNIFGYSEKELVGKNLQMLIPETYRAKHAAGTKRYLKDGQSKTLGRRVEMEGLRKDGSIFPLELEVEETKRDKGNIRIFAGAIRDITNRRKAEGKQTELYEQLKSAKQELQNTNVELSDKIEKLEMFQKITMGREKRVIQLKEKVKELEGKLEGKSVIGDQ